MARRFRIMVLTCITCLCLSMTTSCNLFYDIFYQNAVLIIHNQTETTITAVYADTTVADGRLSSSSLLSDEDILPGESAELGKLKKGDIYIQITFADGARSKATLISITKEVMDVYIQE